MQETKSRQQTQKQIQTRKMKLRPLKILNWADSYQKCKIIVPSHIILQSQ